MRDRAKKIQVPVDMQELCAAFEDTSGENRHYLDLETGEIIFIPDERDTEEDENLKEKLCIAINGRGAFRRFKDVLLKYPKERERWFKFSDEKVMDRVNEWLEFEGIEVIRKKQ